MNKRIIQLLYIIIAAILLTSGTALADDEKRAQTIFDLFKEKPEAASEEKSVFEQSYYEGIYDNEFSDDWFYDSYVSEGYETGKNELRGYFGEQSDIDWFSDDEYYRGYYNDDRKNDWWFDIYADPRDSRIWDF